jgi:hypothetical protein
MLRCFPGKNPGNPVPDRILAPAYRTVKLPFVNIFQTLPANDKFQAMFIRKAFRTYQLFCNPTLHSDS